MLIELKEAGLSAECQVSLQVFYCDVPVGHFVADLIVDDTIIVELRAVEEVAKAHEVQLVNYLTATGKPIGLLINFSPSGVVVRRKVRDLSDISC